MDKTIVVNDTTNINISMDKELKKQAEQLFWGMGMNINTAFTIFVKQAVKDGGIPFEINAAQRISKETNIQKRLDSWERFFNAIDSIKGEDIADKDIAHLQQNRLGFQRNFGDI
jgi:addiction module RelB/DinJ family antitoxin